jgi:hypothetical protein
MSHPFNLASPSIAFMHPRAYLHSRKVAKNGNLASGRVWPVNISPLSTQLSPSIIHPFLSLSTKPDPPKSIAPKGGKIDIEAGPGRKARAIQDESD